MLFKILLTSLMLISFSVNAKNGESSASTKITVVGIAENEKDAAVIVTNAHLYIIDGLVAWPARYYRKKVKVTGTLIIEEHKKQSTDSMQVQERVGTWRIIKKAKWSLAE